MDFEACFQLGYVSKVHGLKGEIQAFLDVDMPENYKKLESVFVDIDNKLIPFFIERIGVAENKAVIKFEEVDTIEAAENLKNKRLYLPLNKLPKLGQEQFYYHDIIGYSVIDQAEGVLGEIVTIYNLPHQDLIAMQYNNKEVLIPIIDDIVKSVDHEQKEVKVFLPDGLLQIYMED
jgi:16S rRNA processing protein RimM